jgi:galactitol-specific phosphotransferase system IIC component
MAFGPCFSPLGVMVVFGVLVIVLFLWLCNLFRDYFSEINKKALVKEKEEKKKIVLGFEFMGWPNHPLGQNFAQRGGSSHSSIYLFIFSKKYIFNVFIFFFNVFNIFNILLFNFIFNRA